MDEPLNELNIVATDTVKVIVTKEYVPNRIPLVNVPTRNVALKRRKTEYTVVVSPRLLIATLVTAL